MKPTEEQQNAIDNYGTTGDVKVIAYAGTGKTTTLNAMAKSDDTRSGVYLAFNKRIAEEAQLKFPNHVRCSTAHSLAFRSVVRRYNKDKMFKNPRMRDAIVNGDKENCIGSLSFPQTREIVGLTLRRFMQSDDERLDLQHAPSLKKMGFGSDLDFKRLQAEGVVIARKIWDRMTDPDDALPMGHDGYLKVWALDRPNIGTDVMFVDEAQDLNPVMVGIVKCQGSQVVAVGDSYQQIYEWRGAKDALTGEAGLDGAECLLTQSFRFGQDIAVYGNQILKLLDARIPLSGLGGEGWVEQYEEGINANMTATDAVLCRSNGGVVECLINALNDGRDVFIPGGVDELTLWVQDAERLQCNQTPFYGEFVPFKTWDELVEYSETIDGEHLAVFCRLVNKWGCQKLRNALEAVKRDYDDGQLTISTTHKAKGLEWDSVIVHSDFLNLPIKKELGPIAAPAIRKLLYVAMTRAKTELIIPSATLQTYQEATKNYNEDQRNKKARRRA